MNDTGSAADVGPGDPPERTVRQVWRLGANILAIQVATMLLLWLLQAAFSG
jgi:hypothetical protein